MAGRAGEARKLLAEMHELAQRTYISPFGFACIYIELGELDKSMEWLERAIDERDGMVSQIHVHPQYSDPLRSHPRYHALLRKMNLEA